jgi:hypothetical protein
MVGLLAGTKNKVRGKTINNYYWKHCETTPATRMNKIRFPTYDFWLDEMCSGRELKTLAAVLEVFKNSEPKRGHPRHLCTPRHFGEAPPRKGTAANSKKRRAAPLCNFLELADVQKLSRSPLFGIIFSSLTPTDEQYRARLSLLHATFVLCP